MSFIGKPVREGFDFELNEAFKAGNRARKKESAADNVESVSTVMSVREQMDLFEEQTGIKLSIRKGKPYYYDRLDIWDYDGPISLPDGLTVTWNLWIINCTGPISLPPGLHVKRGIRIENCPKLTSLPVDLVIEEGSLTLENCTGLTSLPPWRTIVSLGLNDCTSLTSLPQGLTIKYGLVLDNCTCLTSLPSGLTVGYNLWLTNCTGLTSLPSDLTVKGDYICRIPDNLKPFIKKLGIKIDKNGDISAKDWMKKRHLVSQMDEAFRAGNRARKKETLADTVSDDMIDPIQDIIGTDPDEFPYGKGNPSNYRHEVNALVRLAERFPERCKWSNPNFIGEAGSEFVIDDRLFIEISTDYEPNHKDCNMKYTPDLFFMGNSHAKKCAGRFDNQFNPVLNSYRQNDWRNVKDVLCGEIGFPDKDVEIESNADELAMPAWGYVYVSMYRENIEKLVRWVLFSNKTNEAFKAGNRARKKEAMQDAVESVDSMQAQIDRFEKQTGKELEIRDGRPYFDGDLDLRGCTGLTSLPVDLKVNESLNLEGCTGLTSLPAGLEVGSFLCLTRCTGLTSLPDGLKVGGGLWLADCTGLTSLPDGLEVEGSLDLSGCTGLSGLPDGLKVGGDLHLTRCTGLTSLPVGLEVEDRLDLRNCTGLSGLPAGLKVGGDLYLIGCTGLTSLPSDLVVQGKWIVHWGVLKPFFRKLGIPVRRDGDTLASYWRRWQKTHGYLKEAFKAGNRARKKETVADTVEELDCKWPDMPKCIKVINELVRMGEWIHMGDLADRNVNPETTDWWCWHLMPARDLNGGMAGHNDYHIFDLHIQLRKEDSEDPESRVACMVYLYNDIPENIIQDERKRQMANSCTAYLDFHGPDYDGDNPYIKQGPVSDDGKLYHFSGGPERSTWRWVDNKGLSNILKLIMDAGTDRFRQEMDSIAHCKPISVKLGYFGTNCWGNSNIYPLLCTFIEQWMSPSALRWSLGYDTNEYGRGNQLREWRSKVEAWQKSKRMNEDGECCGDAGGAVAAPMPCAPVQTVMNTVGVGDPVPAGAPDSGEFGSGDRFDLQLGESPNKKSKKKPAQKKGAYEAFKAGNRARKKESVQDTAAVTETGYPDFDTVKKTLSRILNATGARESHEGWWSTEENMLKPDGIRSSDRWYFSFKVSDILYCSYRIMARVYNADTDKHPCLVRLVMGISDADQDLLYITLGPKYDNSWMTPEDGKGYWSGPLMAISFAAEHDFPEKVKALADAVTSPDFKALIQAIYTVSVPEQYFHSVVRLIMSPVMYEFYTDKEKKYVDEFFLGRMVMTSMAIRNSESFSKETLDLLKKIAAMWEKHTGQKANLVSFTAIDEAFKAGNRARKKESAVEAVADITTVERRFQSAKLVATEIKLTLPKYLKFRIPAETPTAWSGFITPRDAREDVQKNMILINVQEREGEVTIYVSHYAGGSKASAIRSNWTDTAPVQWDNDRYIASDKTIRDLYNYIDLHRREMFEAFRAGNRARKKESVVDTVESVDNIQAQIDKFREQTYIKLEIKDGRPYFGRSLWMNGCTELTSLPAGLKVEGRLDLEDCTGLTSLPAGLEVEGSLDLSGCTGLTGLPDELKVEGDLHLTGCTGLTSLSAGLKVGRSLILTGCTGLTSLPDGLRVRGDLWIKHCTGLTVLPSDLVVQGNWIVHNGILTPFFNKLGIPVDEDGDTKAENWREWQKTHGYLKEAFRAGNRARKKETAQDTVEGVSIDWNKAVQNIFDETEETNLRSGSYMKDMLPEKLAPIIEKMPGVTSVSVKNSFWGGKELMIITPDHPDHRKIDGRFDIFLQPVYTRSSDGDTNLGATFEAILVFGYHDPDEITVNDFKYKWRSEIGRFSPLHTDRWGEALARLCDFAGNSGFDMLDRLMTLDKWAHGSRPFLGPDSITSTFKAMNLDLFKDNIISCMSGSSWNVMQKTIKQLEPEGK